MAEYISQNEIKTIENLEFFANQVVEGFITGLHKSPYHGFSVEFAEHRLYNTGESTRNIDWKLYARTDKLFVKRFEEETNLRCQLVIDRSSSMHFPVQKMAIEYGFNVMSDKPMTYNLNEAKELISLVESSDITFGLTHNYTGYPMVKEARNRVKNREIGEIRKIVMEYSQGWLATFLESEDNKQASWRTDPNRAGGSCCIGDIGVHAENLSHYITGLEIDSICSEFSTFVKGRSLEDDANVLIRYQNGAKGILISSQISVDEENRLNIRIYGSKGGLEWDQQEPNTLILKHLNSPREYIKTGANYGSSRLSNEAIMSARLPAGHPEGYLEAFAVLYRNFAKVLKSKLDGKKPEKKFLDFPNHYDGYRGMSFIEACISSSNSKNRWTKPKYLNK